MLIKKIKYYINNQEVTKGELISYLSKNYFKKNNNQNNSIKISYQEAKEFVEKIAKEVDEYKIGKYFSGIEYGMYSFGIDYKYE